MQPEPAPKPVIASHEARARRDGPPAWMPASGRPGYEFPRRDLPREARMTLLRIARGGPMPYPKRDGSIHRNDARDLPDGHRYREFTVTGTGQPRSARHGFGDRGRRRLVISDDGSTYYTASHYDRAPRRKLSPAQKETLRDRLPLEWQNAMYRVQTPAALQQRLRQRMQEWDRKQGPEPFQPRPAARQSTMQKGSAMPSSKPPPLKPTFNRLAAKTAQKAPPPSSPAPVLKPRGAPPEPGPGMGGSPATPAPARSANVKPPAKKQTLSQNFNRQSRGIKP